MVAARLGIKPKTRRTSAENDPNEVAAFLRALRPG
jgi:hypothetical protein